MQTGFTFCTFRLAEVQQEHDATQTHLVHDRDCSAVKITEGDMELCYLLCPLWILTLSL